MEMWKSCFFIGHREANEGLLPRLELQIDRLITDDRFAIFMWAGMAALIKLQPRR